MEDIIDPIGPIEHIVKKVGEDVIKELYKVDEFKNSTELLMKIGLARGQLQKGGTVDLDKAAKILLNDWN